MQILLPHTMHPCESLVDVLQYWSTHQPEAVIYRFLTDEDNQAETLTYGQLAQQAKAIAALLQEKGIQPKDRVILIYPPGLELIAAYFGCLYAGVIAVPVYPPLNHYLVEKLQRILVNSQAKLLLTTTTIQHKLKQLKLLKKILHLPLLEKIAKQYWSKQVDLTAWDCEKITWLTTDDIVLKNASLWRPPTITANQLAFLQYTSGSTGHPKGVEISHGNLLHNLSILHQVTHANKKSSGANWVPPYHDMGLIGAILLPVFVGFTSTLMSPLSFLRRPYRWLKAITDFQATICTAPDFAYDYCVRKISEEEKSKLNLSCWEVAINGAEPIHLETLERFYEAFKNCGLRKEAFCPSYGLAEATLIVSGSEYLGGFQYHYFSTEELKNNRVLLVEKNHPNAKALVSSGMPKQDLFIVHPKTHRLCKEHEIGEIWIHSASVAQGYWQQQDETESTFHAHITGDPDQINYLRTGDLGFLYQKQLYVTGRIKDLIIIHGMNYYPQDIEKTVNHSQTEIRSGGTTVFTVNVNGEEKLVIVSEVKSELKETHQKICELLCQVILEQHEIPVYSIVLISPKTLPKTTSGKLRRRYTKELFETKKLISIFQWQADGLNLKPSKQDKSMTPTESFLCTMCSNLIGRPIYVHDSFAQLGIDSLLATQVLTRIRDQYDLEIPIQSLFECRNISELAQLIIKLQKEGKNHG